MVGMVDPGTRDGSMLRGDCWMPPDSMAVKPGGGVIAQLALRMFGDADDTDQSNNGQSCKWKSRHGVFLGKI